MRSTLISLMTFAVLAGGCKKKEPEAPTPVPAPVPVAVAPEPIAEPAPIIPPVLFETGVKTVAASEMPVVDQAVEILKTTDWTCLVVGLSDASGDDEANKLLSQERADAVAAVLLEKSGVPATRIRAHGIGEKLATSTTVNERKVEFVFYEDKGLPLKQVVINSRVLEADFRAKKNE